MNLFFWNGIRNALLEGKSREERDKMCKEYCTNNKLSPDLVTRIEKRIMELEIKGLEIKMA